MSASKSDRPVDLVINLFEMPIAAVASIAHRISGVGLFFGVGFLLYLADLAFASEAGFAEALAVLQSFWGQLLLFLTLFGLAYHLFAGIKHLLLDLHVGDTPAAAQQGAIVVIVLGAISAALAGVWVW